MYNAANDVVTEAWTIALQGWRFAADGSCTDVPQVTDAKANAQVCSSLIRCCNELLCISHETAMLHRGRCKAPQAPASLRKSSRMRD